MNILIKKILLILLPAVALVIAFELLARTIPTSYQAKHQNLMRKKDRIEVLVTGSSHANFGINPGYFGREAFNISNTSQCLYQDYSVLQKYLPLCKNVKMVIVPISYFTVQSDLVQSPEAWRCAYYSLYMGVNGAKSPAALELKKFSALALWDGPIGVINGVRNVNKVEINAYGFQTAEKSTTSIAELINDKAGIARVDYHDKFMDHNLLQSNIALLDKLAAMLRKKNIQMVIVTTPVYKTYSEHASQKNYDLMSKTIADVSKKYSLSYFNYFYDNRFDIRDFSDNDHLNEAGAKKFSVILKNEVIDKLMQ